MSHLPTISVVVPSYRRLDRLSDMLDHWLRQDLDELVVVLDGPHDGAEAALARATADPRMRLITLPENRGRSIARSVGLEAATCDVVLVADDDVLPLEGLVERHRAFHAEHPRSALLGYMPVRLTPRRGRDEAATRIYARDYENQVAVWRTGDAMTLLTSFWGGNASIPRDLYREAEAYRPPVELGYNEDLDLGLRLAAIGAGAGFDERAAARHLHTRGIDAFVAECVVRGEAVADLEDLWPELPGQLGDLVVVPATHGRLGRIQQHIGDRDTPGTSESIIRIAYRVAGVFRAWRLQDALARFLRRAMAIRGYRLRRALHPTSVG
ncbi:hypothetical protein DEI81_01425 [Curtobacterium sp. MCBD17_013]|uniref:glycosyltransferase n=1 Tax=unclassified Curtobacterium TaxID=257496 RepID=UPI000DA75AAA|nr:MULTISPECIES: glycosyltransferase [unclassified Curtobacterium]PZF66305.1 hypothetical protein DEI81_01425 [Curtobacterium sp. MCBD17_013]WIB64868.1 glycosyltransferase [Curtobacterium sp. MCBD17_040]